VGDPVHERVAERERQPGEDEHGKDRDHGDGEPAPAQPALHDQHQRVQQQRDEPGDDQQQDDLAQPEDDLAGEVDEHHRGDRGQDRPQRHALGLCHRPQPGPPGRVGVGIDFTHGGLSLLLLLPELRCGRGLRRTVGGCVEAGGLGGRGVAARGSLIFR
jgi:hypothetical protein